MKTLAALLLATAAATASPATIVQSVSYSTANGGASGLFAPYAGPADQLVGVTFDLGITYGGERPAVHLSRGAGP